MEDEKRKLYEAGELSLDVNDMRSRLAKKGLVYE
jgi:4-hydroxy-4-methyl-2-oxoglutarate aldolase